MSDYVLSVNNLYKSFFSVPVLKDIRFTIASGVVCALLGENGAGKSTLIKILSGVYTADSGDIYILGKKLSIRNPKDAITNGIITIHQELSMCPHLTSCENLFLAKEYKSRFGVLDTKKMQKEATTLLTRFNMEKDVNKEVRDLSIAKQQMLEIARAVSLSSKVVIMDEPTSSLSDREIIKLFDIIKDLKKNGIAVIYITHRLEEIAQVADSVVVLRDGNFIMQKEAKDTNIDEIVSAMAGRDVTEKYPRVNVQQGENILSVSNLSYKNVFKNISFDLKSSEIVGMAGLVGAGRTEIAKTIFGAFPKTSGSIKLNGENIQVKNIRDSISRGIVYVSEDRKLDGLAIKMSSQDNFALPNTKLFYPKFLIKHQKLVTHSLEIVEKMKIKLNSLIGQAKFLSGGNQQKVMIGKWLMSNPKVFLFDEPTRGVDVNAKVSIYQIINNLKLSGAAILLISSEIPELLGITDKIIVVSNGKIVKILDTKNTNQEEILRYATES